MKNDGIIAACILIALGIWLWLQYEAEPDTTTNSGGATVDDESGVASDFITAWAQGVAIAENVDPADNNPGGINAPGVSGPIHFPTLQQGISKLDSLLQSFKAKYGGESILDATAIYILGPSGAAADAGNYPASVVNEAKIVAQNLGASIYDTLDQAAGRFGQ